MTVVQEEYEAIAVKDTTETQPLISFYTAYPDSLPPMAADRSALGSIPSQAYQYCEAVTTASAFGWYAFPAAPCTLIFDGVDVYLLEDGEKRKFSALQLDGMDQWWNKHCPADLHDMAPPFITNLGIPGYVQIWSGLLIESRKNWSTLIRPIANAPISNQFFCFEGIVETDSYSPAPLFVNLKLQVTHTPIEFSHLEPLFQIQPIHRNCYSKKSLNNFVRTKISNREEMTASHWQRYANTVRHIDPRDGDHKTGQYAIGARKRSKRNDGDERAECPYL